MSRSVHIFRSPDRFITGAVGQPGERSFFIQVIRGTQIVTVALEKQQVQILADRIDVLLDEVNNRFGVDIPPKADHVNDLYPLIMPLDAEFRVGTMGLGWDAIANAVVVELLAIYDGEIDESVVLDDAEEGPDAVRVFLTPHAAREFALRSEMVVSAGRPPCPLCDKPISQEGHLCIRLNGYRRDVQLDRSHITGDGIF